MLRLIFASDCPLWRSVRRALAAALTWGLVSGAALAAESAPADSEAAANEAGGTLEEVTVTAQKREQSEQVVPVSITALSGESLNQQVVLNVRDLMEHVTGLVVAPNSQGDAATFAIRSSKQDNGTTGGVAVYLDEMPLTSTYSVANANYDISSVDVLKGPQGTLFGQSATGGAIVFRANKPTKDFDAWVWAQYGDYRRSQFTGMVNLPVNDALQVRLAADYVNRPVGFVKNLAPNPAAGLPAELWTDRHSSARLSVRLITGAVTNDFVGDYYSENDAPSQSVLTELVPSVGALGVPLLNRYNQVALGGNASGIDLPIYKRITSWGIKDTLTWPISEHLTFVNNIGYRNDTQDTFQSSSSEVVDMVNGRTRIKQLSGVEEATVHFDMGRVHNTTGIFLNALRKSDGNSYDLAQNFTYLIHIPAGVFGPGTPAIDSPLAQLSNSYYNRRMYSIAPYSQTELKLSDELTAILGVRYNWDHGSFDDQQRGGSPPANFFEPQPNGNFFFGPCNPATIKTYPHFDPAACLATNTARFTAPSWNFGLQDQFAERSMIYFRVAHGYIAGGFNNQISDVKYQTFQPEKTTEYEAGLKADWSLAGRPIRTNVALFNGDVSNKQEVENGATCVDQPTLTAAQCIAFYAGNNITSQWIGVFNAGTLNYYGFDLSAEFLPFAWLQLNAGWTFVESHYTSFAFPTVGEIPSRDLSGSTPAQVPKNTMTASAKLIWPIPSTVGNISSTLSLYHRSETNFQDIFNNCNVQTAECLLPTANTAPAYTVMDFSTFWNGVFGSHIDLTGYVKNVADKHYAVFKSPQASLGYATTNFGEPRTFGLGIRYNLR
ncbi:MAG: TonB-dependent receptor [Steroidobacteraceae bacterium]